MKIALAMKMDPFNFLKKVIESLYQLIQMKIGTKKTMNNIPYFRPLI